MKKTILPKRAHGQQSNPFGSPEVRKQRDTTKGDATATVRGGKTGPIFSAKSANFGKVSKGPKSKLG